MYTKAIIPALLLAGQAVALPATTITLHSTITSTTIVPAVTDAAGSNPSNAATPAVFSPSAENPFLTTFSSFSDASPFGAAQVTVTVTETQGIPYPVLITVTDYYCPSATAEVESSTSASSERTSATVSSTAAPASSTAIPSSEPKSSPAPATTTKACVFPIPGKCDD
ncbi:hypothetical protein KCU85_g6977, partial [Aureobasidium melanogenum]